MTIYRPFSLLLCSAIACGSAWSAPYLTDPAKLSSTKQQIYTKAQDTLNNYRGEHEKILEAEAMIESVIQSEPNFLPIYIEKARMTIMRAATGVNDYKDANRKALKIIEAVQAKDPNYAKAYVLAGHVLTNLGDYAGAQKALNQAMRIGTTDPWLYNNLADVNVALKQYDMAIENARKAMLLSKDNGKALLVAIHLISEYAHHSGKESGNADITRIVFESIKDPDQRMLLANRLTHTYQGNPTVLRQAYEMIDRQAKETPRRESVDLAMAELMLKQGYMRSELGIAKYEQSASRAAEQTLNAIKPSPSANRRIFSNRFAIALSDDNLPQANKLLKKAEADGVARAEIMQSKARLKWISRDYAGVVATLEELAKEDPTVLGSDLLAKAYASLGRMDLLAAHHKRRLDNDPDGAWTLGNYAHFLLHGMNDADGAIKYGEKALARLPYPAARDTTALAYLMKATTLRRSGQVPEAKSNYKRGIALQANDGYLQKYCHSECAVTQVMFLER